MYAVEYPLPSIATQDASLDACAPTLPSTTLRLQNTKKQVQLFRDTRGVSQWRAAVSQTPPPKWNLGSKKPVSRGYFKLYEIIKACAIKPPDRSLHLCEAPGGFLEATLDAFPDVRAQATTLESGPPMSSRFGDHRVALDETDLLHERARAELEDLFTDQRVDLVTADGGFAFRDLDNAEEEALPLVRAQIDVALRTLARGGSFVLKIFGCSTSESVTSLATLCASFAFTSLYKPTLSRPTNSELYVVCREFLGVRAVVTPPPTWSVELSRIVDAFYEKQRLALEEILSQRPLKRGRQ